MTAPLAEIKNLRISFPTEDGGWHQAVRGVSFALGREKLGIVGESGSGKSLSGRALLGVLPDYARVEADILSFDGIDLLKASRGERRKLRGSRLGMVLQDPKFSLNPVMPVGKQIVEAIRIGNRKLGKAEAKKIALDMLESLHIRNPEAVFDRYPHELSGGMGQRIMIAMMVVREPDLLIADEPTSALDVTVQAEILELLRELRDRIGSAIVLITHNMGVVADLADRVAVMYNGELVEEATADYPFRLATSPARAFLNSSFNETPTSRELQGRPTVMLHPDDAATLGIAEGDRVVLGNARGKVRLHATIFDGVRRGVAIAESIWPNTAYDDGKGINTLTGSDAIAPYGGAAVHDTRVWVRRA